MMMPIVVVSFRIRYPVIKNLIMNRFQASGTFQGATSTNGNDALRALVAKLQFSIVYGCFFELPGKLVTYRSQSRTIFFISSIASTSVDIVKRSLQAHWIKSKLISTVDVEPPPPDYTSKINVHDVEANVDYPSKNGRTYGNIAHSKNSPFPSQVFAAPPSVVLNMPKAGEEYLYDDYVNDVKQSLLNLTSSGRTSRSQETRDDKPKQQNGTLRPIIWQAAASRESISRRSSPQPSGERKISFIEQCQMGMANEGDRVATTDDDDGEIQTEPPADRKPSERKLSNLTSKVIIMQRTLKGINVAIPSNSTDEKQLEKINTAFEQYGRIKQQPIAPAVLMTKEMTTEVIH
jgi:hypothetical protein